MVITTSKGKDAKNQGCQPAPKRFFVKGGKHGFPKDTWIDLGRNVFVFDTVKVKEKITCRSAEIKMTLPQQILNEIKNCLARHAKESLTREGCELLGIRT